MPDQQFNSRLKAEKPSGMRPQRRRQLIEVRSVSGIPSGVSITM
jgi:hypothetical protein